MPPPAAIAASAHETAHRLGLGSNAMAVERSNRSFYLAAVSENPKATKVANLRNIALCQPKSDAN